MPSKVKPRYKHDCPYCIFLGRYRKKDLYACESGCPGYSWATVIVRHSSRPSDYTSGLAIAESLEERGKSSHPLVEALHRARLLRAFS